MKRFIFAIMAIVVAVLINANAIVAGNIPGLDKKEATAMLAERFQAGWQKEVDEQFGKGVYAISVKPSDVSFQVVSSSVDGRFSNFVVDGAFTMKAVALKDNIYKKNLTRAGTKEDVRLKFKGLIVVNGIQRPALLQLVFK